LVLLTLRILAINPSHNEGGEVLTSPFLVRGVIELAACFIQPVQVCNELLGVLSTETVPLADSDPLDLTRLSGLHQPQEVGSPVCRVACPSLVLEPISLRYGNAVALLELMQDFVLAKRILLVVRHAYVGRSWSVDIQLAVAVRGAHAVPPF